jgi:hypothetical protein
MSIYLLFYTKRELYLLSDDNIRKKDSLLRNFIGLVCSKQNPKYLKIEFLMGQNIGH